MSLVATLEDRNDDIRLGVLGEAIGFRLRRIQNHLSRAFSDRLAHKYIRPGLFSALALISANSGMSQRTLGREIGLDKATVVAILDTLEKLGWAERKRVPDDRRRHALHVTPEGAKELTQLHEVALAVEAPVRAVLSDEEQRQLFALLDKVYAACFAEPLDANS